MHKHIPRQVAEEYRESLKSDHASREFHRKNPEFCERTMDYFEKMGEFAENAATQDDVRSSQKHTESLIIETNRSQLEIIQGNKDEADQKFVAMDRRQNDLESRFQQVEHMARSTQASSDRAVDVGVETLKAVNDLSGKVSDLAIYHMENSGPRPATPSKKPSLAGIPNIGWVVIGVVSIMSIAALTSTLPQFYGWLGTFKFFGGA